MAQISPKMLHDAEQRAQTALAPFLAAQDYKGAAAYCLGDGMVLTQHPPELLVNVFLILWFLEHRDLHKNKSLGTAEELVRAAEVALLACAIRPYSSRYAGLYGRLYRAISLWHAAHGNPWLAAWQANLGLIAKGNPQQLEAADAGGLREQLFVANRNLALGSLATAASTFLRIEANATDPELMAEARLGRVHCHKLGGDLDQAWTLAKSAKEDYPDSEASLDLEWQGLLLESLIGQNAAPMAVASDSRSRFFQARFALQATMIGHALPPSVRSLRLPRASTLKAKYEDISRGSDEHRQYGMLLVLEAFADDSSELHHRLSVLGERIAAARDQATPEEHLVFLAACARSLAHAKQPSFLAYVLQEYSGISIRLAEGRTSDVLRLIPDLISPGGEPQREPVQTTLVALPSSRNAVMFKLSSIVARATLLKARDSLRRAFSLRTPTEEDDHRFINELVTAMIDELGGLKGPLLKVGQLFSGINALPPDARLKIQQSLGSTLGVAPDAFLRIFKSEQKKSVAEAFASFDPKPIGVGSMGQVFRASMHDGRVVAVKIHYPGMDKRVQNFLPWARLMSLPLVKLLPRVPITEIITRVTTTFAEECDMHLEAEKHLMVQTAFADTPDVLIPKLYPEMTSKSVLVMEYIPGMRLFEFIPHASLEERARFYSVIARQHTAMIDRLGFLQLDPHGGNYLFYQGKVVCLDFGSLIKINDESRKQLIQMVSLLSTIDPELLWNLSQQHGLFDPTYISKEFHREHFAPIVFGRRHPGFDPERHSPHRFFSLLKDEKVRRGVTFTADRALWFVTINFLFALRETFNLDIAAEGVTTPFLASSA